MGLMGHFDDAHLLKVDVDGIVQDALTVCLVHHDQRVHLQQQPQPNVIFTRLLLQKSLKDTFFNCTFSLETFACSSRC